MLRVPAWLPFCLFAASALAAPRAEAQLRDWRIDPVHTRVAFAVDHAGFSKALGTFSGATGTLRFDPADLATASLEVDIPVASLELGDAKWNQASLARNLLDAAAHPVARFVSTRIEALGEGRAIVHGVLTLRGQSREVALDAVVNAVKRHPMPPFRRTAGFSASTTLRRSEFGIDAWRSMIGDEVELRIEAEATLVRGTGAHDPATDTPAPIDDDTPPDADADADVDVGTRTDTDTDTTP
jgi:polyisoprenoid-binding protein YceI